MYVHKVQLACHMCVVGESKSVWAVLSNYKNLGFLLFFHLNHGVSQLFRKRDTTGAKGNFEITYMYGSGSGNAMCSSCWCTFFFLKLRSNVFCINSTCNNNICFCWALPTYMPRYFTVYVSWYKKKRIGKHRENNKVSRIINERLLYYYFHTLVFFLHMHSFVLFEISLICSVCEMRTAFSGR